MLGSKSSVYTKFYVDDDGDINVEYDFPVHSPDDGIGEMALELFVRAMKILDSEYGIFMRALYSDDVLDIQEGCDPAELMQQLQRLQALRRMMMAQMATMDDTDDEDSDGCEQDCETPDSPDSVAC